MLQSFLIVYDGEIPATVHSDESPLFPFALYVDEPEPADGKRFDSPLSLFSAAGLRATAVAAEPSSELDVSKADAVVFSLSYQKILQWTPRMEADIPLPMLWWCEREPLVHNCTLSDAIDGILYPGMTTDELHWSLLLSTKHYLNKTQWKKEREQLLLKLEDRKWIERAKAILSEVKSISEAEAYEFLRKQAMNERRRMVDVAVSIVKVYSLLREQNPRGRTR